MILASVLTTNIAILVLAGFVGFMVISKIPNTLHTPLMSGTNAIHGIVLLGGLLLLALPSVGLVKLDALSEALLVIAVAFGTINVVGGFLVTDRMLDMFKAKPKSSGPDQADAADGKAGSTGSSAVGGSAGSLTASADSVGGPADSVGGPADSVGGPADSAGGPADSAGGSAGGSTESKPSDGEDEA